MPSRRELANAIRVLAIDAIQQANSGHPGAPMEMAELVLTFSNIPAEVTNSDQSSH